MTPDLQPGQFSAQRGVILKIVSLVSCTVSIAAIVLAFIWWNRLLRKKIVKRKLFRHQVVLLLLWCDFLKAITLIIYPIKFLKTLWNFQYGYVSTFCNVLGFFTSVAIECADFANFTLALHTVLKVFEPKSAGLEAHKYMALLAFFVAIPITLASLGFIPSNPEDSSGYAYQTKMCYYRKFPVWYTLVLAWVPRLIIMVSILGIYLAIYITLKNQIRHLEGSFGEIWRTTTPEPTTAAVAEERLAKHRRGAVRPSVFGEGFLHGIRKKLAQLPGLSFLVPRAEWKRLVLASVVGRDHNDPLLAEVVVQNENESAAFNPDQSPEYKPYFDSESFSHHSFPSSTHSHTSIRNADTDENGDEGDLRTQSRQQQEERLLQSGDQSGNQSDPAKQLQAFIHSSNYQQFQRTRTQIEWSMNIMFVYPGVYCCIWLFPLIEQMMNIHRDLYQDSVFWIALLATLSVPLSGLINSILFISREYLPHYGTGGHRPRVGSASGRSGGRGGRGRGGHDSFSADISVSNIRSNASSNDVSSAATSPRTEPLNISTAQARVTRPSLKPLSSSYFAFKKHGSASVSRSTLNESSLMNMPNYNHALGSSEQQQYYCRQQSQPLTPTTPMTPMTPGTGRSRMRSLIHMSSQVFNNVVWSGSYEEEVTLPSLPLSPLSPLSQPPVAQSSLGRRISTSYIMTHKQSPLSSDNGKTASTTSDYINQGFVNNDGNSADNYHAESSELVDFLGFLRSHK